MRGTGVMMSEDAKEQEQAVYQVAGQKVQLQAYSITARCPHKKANLETGEIEQCPGIVTTIRQEKMVGTDKATGEQKELPQLRITWDPKAVGVFDAGGTVAIICGYCGSKLEVTRGKIARVRPNMGINRAEKRRLKALKN